MLRNAISMLRKVGAMAFSITLFLSCTKKDPRPAIWIYTSMYKDVIAELDPILQKKYPHVKIQWYQSGSENVQARLNAELLAGQTTADLVLTSDPFWYLELKKAGHFIPFPEAQSKLIPTHLKDPEHAFVTVRIPVVVIGYDSKSISKTMAPKTWDDLTLNQWKGKISMPSPLESGTCFSAVAQLVHKKGWNYFKKLRQNDILSSGGNSSVISRIETNERPLGITLLENILEAQKRGSSIDAIYPKEGSILIPSPIGILKQTKNKALAMEIYNSFLGDDLQKAIVNGRMYSPNPNIPAPIGAMEFKDLLLTDFKWNPLILEDLYKSREEIKKQYMNIVLN